MFASIDPPPARPASTPTAWSCCATASTNPALGGGLVLRRLGTDQLGHARPQPSGSSPDIGAAELNQTLSTNPSNNNDTLTGTSATNTISGGLGNDRILGLAGNDTLNGNDGSDTFDGGAGNDKINGGTGVDIALYSGSTALVFDLSGTTDRVTQGSAVDTLTGIEGGGRQQRGRHLQGRCGRQLFRGGDGKDTSTGGGGRDTYYYTSAQNSPATSGRDVITDFVHGQDKIDLAGSIPTAPMPAIKPSTGSATAPWAPRLATFPGSAPAATPSSRAAPTRTARPSSGSSSLESSILLYRQAISHLEPCGSRRRSAGSARPCSCRSQWRPSAAPCHQASRRR